MVKIMASYAMNFNREEPVDIHPLIKNLLSILLGTGMTLLLLLVMHSLIKNDTIQPEMKKAPAIPEVNSTPPILETIYPELELPIKPELQVIPPVQKSHEPITIGVKPVKPIIPIVINHTKGVMPTLDNNPILPMVKVNPAYPHTAALKGIEGFVDVIFDVTETGSTQNIEVVYAEPERIFNSAVIKAVSRWKYKPKMEDGSAVRVTGVRERIRFNLDK